MWMGSVKHHAERSVTRLCQTRRGSPQFWTVSYPKVLKLFQRHAQSQCTEVRLIALRTAQFVSLICQKSAMESSSFSKAQYIFVRNLKLPDLHAVEDLPNFHTTSCACEEPCKKHFPNVFFCQTLEQVLHSRRAHACNEEKSSQTVNEHKTKKSNIMYFS